MYRRRIRSICHQERNFEKITSRVGQLKQSFEHLDRQVLIEYSLIRKDQQRLTTRS